MQCWKAGMLALGAGETTHALQPQAKRGKCRDMSLLHLCMLVSYRPGVCAKLADY